MELAILLLVFFLAGQKDAQKQELPPPELLQGDWKALVHSEWFGRQTLGGVSGKEIAQAAGRGGNHSKIRRHPQTAAERRFFRLSSLTGADELFKNLGGLASLAQGARGLGNLFGGAGVFGGTAESNAPENDGKTPFAPIANIADAEILCALTRYFA